MVFVWKLVDTEGAMPGQPFAFIVDATGTGGLGDVAIDIVHDKQSVPFRIEDIGHMRYRVSLVPRDAGKYRVYLYFNGSDVRGSPISIRVGTQKGSRRSKGMTSSSSAERSKVTSNERRMNGINVNSSEHTKTRQSPTGSNAAYKTSSPTQAYRDYSPHQQFHQQNFSSSYNKSSSNYASENSTSYHHSGPINSSRSPVQNNVGRNSSSPSIIKESKEIYSSSAFNRSRSPNPARSPTQESPSLIKESKDIYATTTVNRPRSPLTTNTNLRESTHSTSLIKESKDIYQSSSLTRPRSPNRSPMAFRSSNESPINRSFSPRTNDKDFSLRRRGSIESAVVDTSSNVRGATAKHFFFPYTHCALPFFHSLRLRYLWQFFIFAICRCFFEISKNIFISSNDFSRKLKSEC